MINLEVSDFSHDPALNGTYSLALRHIDLARSVISAGYEGLPEAHNTSDDRATHLLYLTRAFTAVDEDRLVLSPILEELDPSEKRGVGYHLGQGLTNAIAQAKLETQCLVHLSRMKDKVQLWRSPVRAPSKKLLPGQTGSSKAREPDLIGVNNETKAPYVLEAKGYTSGFSSEALQHAIDQVSQVRLVNGQPPLARIACFFNLKRKPFFGRIVDPVEHRDIGLRLSFEYADLVRAYYRPFLGLAWSTASILKVHDRKFRVRLIGCSHYFGVDDSILQSLSGGKLPEREHQWYLNAYRRQDAIFFGAGISIGLDGIILVDAGASPARLAQGLSRRCKAFAIAAKKKLSPEDVTFLTECLKEEDPPVQWAAADAFRTLFALDLTQDDFNALIEALTELLGHTSEDLSEIASAAIENLLEKTQDAE